jgi:TonB family protein
MNLPEKDKPFGKYDAAIIEATTKKWNDILDRQKFKVDRSGKVVMRFHLHQDGTVSSVKAVENSAGYVLGFLCSRAIKEAAPFAPWPPDMMKMLNQDYREITFTFYYQ